MERRGGGTPKPPQRGTSGVEWAPLKRDRAPAASQTRRERAAPTLVVPPLARTRWESAQKTMTQEQAEKVSALEEGIRSARRGLDQIREAFDYKANDPDLRKLGADIDTWATHYGPKREGFGEKIGRFVDTQESRLRADARQYYALERSLERLEIDLLTYKQQHGLS